MRHSSDMVLITSKLDQQARDTDWERQVREACRERDMLEVQLEAFTKQRDNLSQYVAGRTDNVQQNIKTNGTLGLTQGD